MKNPDNRFRSDAFNASLPVGAAISAKSQSRRKKIDGVNPCAMVLVSEGQVVEKSKKIENLEFN